MRIYVGYDERLAADWEVAARSGRKYGYEVLQLSEHKLRMQGLLTRPMDRRGGMFDLNSGAPQSTEFAISRFFVPMLAHDGWALFVDSDIVFLEHPREIFVCSDPKYAVLVVKHPEMRAEGFKMDGQKQTSYARKLWSSVMLFNCHHPANLRLNLMTLNSWPGRDLHAFRWLADDEIGELPPEANWLVGLQPKPARPLVAHYTLGTPNMKGYENCEHAELWRKEAA